MGGNLGSAGIAAANNGLPAGGFRSGSGLGMGVALPMSGAGFWGIGLWDRFRWRWNVGWWWGGGRDGRDATCAAGSVTLGMYQSFMQRNGEGGQGQ